MSVTTCVVTGTLKDLSGTAIEGAAVYAYSVQPILYSDGTMLAPYKVSTTTASDGTWSLTLAETTSISRNIVIAIDMPSGSSQTVRREYTVTIPASGPVTFASLITGQI